jgi:hypothetical protein
VKGFIAILGECPDICDRPSDSLIAGLSTVLI